MRQTLEKGLDYYILSKIEEGQEIEERKAIACFKDIAGVFKKETRERLIGQHLIQVSEEDFKKS